MEEVVVFNRLVDIFKSKKNSHVYLIETNDIEKCFELLLIFIKKINCPKKYKNGCNECNICNLINLYNLPSLVIIEPDGINIKKDQLIELKKRFSTIPMFTSNNIYVIKYADKLNASSANTMLKFIEEPNENIIGFLLTSNINNVMETIKSRCEIIKCNFAIDDKIIENKYIDTILEYLYKLEVEKKDDILYNRTVVLNKFSDREDIINIFKTILEIYQRTFIKQYFPGNEKFIFLSKLNQQQLHNRIKLTTLFLENINYNVNIELLMDKYVIELSDYYVKDFCS